MANTSSISYNTFGKKQLVVPPRTAFYRKILPITWSDITIGITLNTSQATEPNHPNSTATSPGGGFYPSYLDARSLLSIGVRNSTNLNAFPGESGVKFAGLGQISSTHNVTPVASSIVGYGTYSDILIHPLVSSNTSFNGVNFTSDSFRVLGIQSGAPLIVFRLVKSSTQIAIGYKGSLVSTTASPATIESLLSEISANNPATLYTLPFVDDPLAPLDTFWVYMPWYGISMKINKLAIIYNS